MLVPTAEIVSFDSWADKLIPSVIVANSTSGGHTVSWLPLHKKWSFLLRISSVNVTEIRNGTLHFLCSVRQFAILKTAVENYWSLLKKENFSSDSYVTLPSLTVNEREIAECKLVKFIQIHKRRIFFRSTLI